MRRALAVAALVASVGLGGYAAGAMTQPEPAALGQLVCAPAPVRVAIVGDSETSWSPPYAGKPAQSWVNTMKSAATPVVGGWAVPGATIADMESGLKYVEADVFVMMVGTNDLPIPYRGKVGTPVDQRLAAMDRMAVKMNATETVVLAVPPFGYGIGQGELWNAQLRDYATSRGFTYLDPWTHAKDSKGMWKAGAHYGDAVHPSPTAAAAVGLSVRNMIAGLATNHTDGSTT